MQPYAIDAKPGKIKALEPNRYNVSINGAELTLLSQRAIFWQQQNIVLVADVHLGKEHVFGRSGIAIPAGSSESTLTRLSNLLTHTGASECVVLGDFFHDTPTPEESWLTALSLFLDRHPSVQVSVIAGNHDKQDGQSLIDERIHWHNDPVHRGPFTLRHEPPDLKSTHGRDQKHDYVLAGHIHPVVLVKPRYQRGVRGPCFWQQNNCLVLPAFGDFTGGYTVTPAPTDSVYLTGPDCIIPIPITALTKRTRTDSKRTRTQHS